MSVDYIKTDNEQLGKNILVHCQDFPKADFTVKIDKCPQQIYVRSNYPKILMASESNGSSGSSNNANSSVVGLYNQSQGDIVFMIHPVDSGTGYQMRQYSSLTQQQIDNYPSMTFTPTGNLISTPVIPDRMFHANYMIFDEKGEKLEDIKEHENTKIVSANNPNEVYEPQIIAWKVNSHFNVIPVTQNNFGNESKYQFEIDNKREMFRYIQSNTTTPSNNNSSTSTGSNSSSKKQISRCYKLSGNILKNNPENNNNSENGNTNSGLSFIFGINFRKGASGTARLMFGDYTVVMDTSKQITLSVKGISKSSSMQIDQQNTLQPAFCSQRRRDWVSFIAYPVWDGIALQSGVVKTTPVQGSNKQGQKTVYPIGVVAQYNLPSTSSTSSGSVPNKGDFLNPKYQSWVRGSDNQDETTDQNDAQKGHIFLTPVNGNWTVPNDTEDKALNNYTLTLINTAADFYYIPLYFLPKSKFKLCFRGIQDKKASVGSTTFYQYGGRTGTKVIYQHTYCANLIYSHPDIKDKRFNVCSEDIKAKKIGSIDATDLYQVDFQLTNMGGESGFPRKPLQIHGVLITNKRTQKSHPIEVDNGEFRLKTTSWSNVVDKNPTTKNNVFFDSYSHCGAHEWIHYATNINLQNNDTSGASGSIVVDKYAFMGQKFVPTQSIGGIRLTLEGGRTDSNMDLIHENEGRRKYIFSGLAMQTNFMDSFNQDTLTINLKGLHHKLQDIKIINAPFWDGDDLRDIMKWVQNYTGVEINCIKYAASSKKNRRIAISTNFSRPALDLQGGSTVISGINTACQMANHRFVIQNDGVGYVYLLSTDFAIPVVYPNAGSSVGANSYSQKQFHLDETNIISLDVQPIFAHVYNIVISAALKGKENGNTIEAPNSQSQLQQVQLNTKVTYQYDKTVPNMPWSRMFAHKHQGYMSLQQLEQRHLIDCASNKRCSLHANISLVGRADMWIYDTVYIFDVPFLVSDISHSIDFMSKQFTTTIQADYFPWVHDK